MTCNHFSIKFENGTRFLEQNMDEMDKNHRENDDIVPNQGRMYENPGEVFLICYFHSNPK